MSDYVIVKAPYRLQKETTPQLPKEYNPAAGKKRITMVKQRQQQLNKKPELRKQQSLVERRRMPWYQHPPQPIQTHKSINRQHIKIPGRLRRDMHRHF